MISITPRWLCLPLLVFAAGITNAPALAQQATNSSATSAPAARLPKGITEKSAKVNGVRINYKIGGKGPVVVLLHR